MAQTSSIWWASEDENFLWGRNSRPPEVLRALCGAPRNRVPYISALGVASIKTVLGRSNMSFLDVDVCA